MPVGGLVGEGGGHVGVGLHQDHLGPKPGLQDGAGEGEVEPVYVDFQDVEIAGRDPGGAEARRHRHRVRVLLHDRDAVLAEQREVLFQEVQNQLVALKGGAAGPALEEGVGGVIGVAVEGAFFFFFETVCAKREKVGRERVRE